MMARKVTRDNSMSNILIGISAQAELASTDPVKLEESRGHGIIASKLRDIKRREQEISKNVLNARKTDVANRVNDDNPDVFRRHGAEYVWSVIEQTIDANKDIASTAKLYSIVSSKLGKPVNQGVAEGISNDMSTKDMIAYLKQHHDKNLHQDYLDHINTFSKFVLQNIPVNSIKTDLPKLDRAKVEQYKQMDFSKAPPIVMGGGYILDGYHRANVAKALGIPTIKAYVGISAK